MGWRRRLSLWLPVAAVAGLILYVSVRDVIPESAPTIPHLDKILHAGAYGLLSLVLARAMGSGLSWWWAAVVASGYGGLMEFIQHFVGRNPSFLDELANAVGAVAAAWVWKAWTRR